MNNVSQGTAEKEPSLMKKFVEAASEIMSLQEKALSTISSNLSYQRTELYKALPQPTTEKDRGPQAAEMEDNSDSLSSVLDGLLRRMKRIYEAIERQSDDLNNNNVYLQKIL